MPPKRKRQTTTDNNNNLLKELASLRIERQKKKQKKKSPKKKSPKKEEELCVICYDPITEEQKTANPSQVRACHPTRAGVSHVFHTECINHWLSGTDVHGNPRNSCPSCGAQIPCLTNQEYDNEFRAADEQYMDQLVDDNVGAELMFNSEGSTAPSVTTEEAAFINSIMWDVDRGFWDGRALAMNEPTGPGSIIADTDEWNNRHPNGPQWTNTQCDYCDNFQWFLSNEPEGSNQPAFDLADWYSWEGNMICPWCQGDAAWCEGRCGKIAVTDAQKDEFLKDPHSSEYYCEDCLRDRYRNDMDNNQLDEFIQNIWDGVENPEPDGSRNTAQGSKSCKRTTKKKGKRGRKKKRKKKNKLTKRKLLTKILKRLRRRGGRKTRHNKNTKKRRRTRRRR